MEKANAKKFEMQVESIEEVKFEEVKKSFAGLANREDIQLDPDLMYAKFIMCHEGTNANGDTFTKDVLQKAQYTPRFKPIDWEHGQPFIGTILDSQYSETEDGVGYIEAIGAIWKFHYPDLADAIKAKSSDGGLKLSMECFYRDANYKYGEQIYTQEQADSLGLIDYVGRAYMGSTVYRVFSDVIFGGVGVVANPADSNAVFLSVAKKKVEAEEAELAVAELHPTNDFNDKIIDKDTFNAVTIAKYIKAFDKAKSSIVGKFNKSQVANKDMVIREVREVLHGLSDDIKVIEQAYYKGQAGDNDPVEDLELFNYDDFVNEQTADDEDKEEREMEEKAKKSLPKDHLDNHDGQEPELAENKLPNGENKDGEKPELAENKLPNSENKDGEEPILAENMDDEEAGKKTKKDPDGDGDDDTTPEGDTDHDVFPAKKKSKADERIAELESSLANITAKFEALQEKVQASEKQAIASNRIAELSELGIEFSEARKSKEIKKVSAMSQSDFDDYKSFLVEIAGVQLPEKSEASEVVTEVTIEEVDTASAGLNVETELPKVIKPFGHLAD